MIVVGLLSLGNMSQCHQVKETKQLLNIHFIRLPSQQASWTNPDPDDDSIYLYLKNFMNKM